MEQGKMMKRILGVMVSFAILCLANVAHSTFIEYASAINPANGHSYYIYYSPTVSQWPFLHVDNTNDISWFEAKTAAEAMGGYLATITNEAEEVFLQSTSAFAGSVKGEGIRAWIGLSDAMEERVFKWVAGPEVGQTLSYADWMVGEPNNAGLEGENYVEWRNYPYGPNAGAWNDVPFDAWGVNTFMVEVNPVPEPATMFVFGTGLVGLVGSRVRKKKK